MRRGSDVAGSVSQTDGLGISRSTSISRNGQAHEKGLFARRDPPQLRALELAKSHWTEIVSISGAGSRGAATLGAQAFLITLWDSETGSIMKIVWTETTKRDIILVGEHGTKVGTGECHPPATVAQNKSDEPELTLSKMVGERKERDGWKVSAIF